MKEEYPFYLNGYHEKHTWVEVWIPDKKEWKICDPTIPYIDDPEPDPPISLERTIGKAVLTENGQFSFVYKGKPCKTFLRKRIPIMSSDRYSGDELDMYDLRAIQNPSIREWLYQIEIPEFNDRKESALFEIYFVNVVGGRKIERNNVIIAQIDDIGKKVEDKSPPFLSRANISVQVPAGITEIQTDQPIPQGIKIDIDLYYRQFFNFKVIDEENTKFKGSQYTILKKKRR